MKKCKGCGVVLQTTDSKLPGYTPKENSDYCQRCFRLMHYDDLIVSMRKGIDPDVVLQKIASSNALILWVVDLFDFEASMIPGINRLLLEKDIIMVCTKRDILPETLSEEKIARFVFSRLKELGIQIKSLILTSKVERMGVEEVMDAIHMYRKNREVIVMGKANSGKSTLLNNLAGMDTLTMSRYPGTTLDFNTLQINGIPFVDTPGIEISKSMVMEVEEEQLKEILPARTLKPLVYQLRFDQSFAIGGLARIDLLGCDHASCVFYMADTLRIHRSKTSGAEALWEKHYGILLKPIPLTKKFKKYAIRKEMDKMDIVIDGLGWACVHGQMSTITVYVPENVNVTFRKAML